MTDKSSEDAPAGKGNCLRRRDRRVMTLADFTNADIRALEKVRAPIVAAAFNDEVTK